MEIEFGLKDEAFRNEVRRFLDRQLTDDLVDATDLNVSAFLEPDISLAWQAKLNKRGWAAPLWPKEYGGTGWTPIQRFIFEIECSLAGAPALSPMGLNYMGPVLVAFGSQEQKQHYLPRILSGQDYWCQGYSEPGAGSDLASLKCAAKKEADHYVVNGTKLWTTHAQFANKIFCLVRTSKEDRPQKGISFLMMDMDAPGITVTPIITAAGDHEVNQVFFDDVKVPIKNLIGQEGDGWSIAKYLLEFERGSFFLSGRLTRKTRKLRKLISLEFDKQGSTSDSSSYRAKLADLEMRVVTLQCIELQMLSSMEGKASPGPESLLIKYEWSGLAQAIDELATGIVGPYALYCEQNPPFSQSGLPLVSNRDYLAPLMPAYFNNRAASIYGGTSEILRTILAKTAVGL